jgi:hypothetical protein
MVPVIELYGLHRRLIRPRRVRATRPQDEKHGQADDAEDGDPDGETKYRITPRGE